MTTCLLRCSRLSPLWCYHCRRFSFVALLLRARVLLAHVSAREALGYRDLLTNFDRLAPRLSRFFSSLTWFRSPQLLRCFLSFFPTPSPRVASLQHGNACPPILNSLSTSSSPLCFQWSSERCRLSSRNVWEVRTLSNPKLTTWRSLRFTPLIL